VLSTHPHTKFLLKLSGSKEESASPTQTVFIHSSIYQ
jgi:hypothetical protein